MRFATRLFPFLLLLAIGTAMSGPASAASLNITWLPMPPIPSGTTVPNGSVYAVPGLGTVTLTYSLPAPPASLWSAYPVRLNQPSLYNLSVANGGNLYGWTNCEALAGTIKSSTSNTGPYPWSVTWTFSQMIPVGALYFGVSGLGRFNDVYGVGTSTATVSQNGTFLGEVDGGNNWGANVFTSVPGQFQLSNSQTGNFAQDPQWNSKLAVIQILDAVTVLTVKLNQIRDDGVGVNIGLDTSLPTPTRLSSWGRVKNLYR